MQYEVSLMPIDRIVLSPKGITQPLCNMCGTRDCTNPVRKMSISIFGVTKEYKLYTTGMGVMAVASCQGFSPQEIDK